jgi:hypothetical protein
MTSGLHGDGAGDAQSLLLAAGQAGARLVQPVFDLFPQAGFAQRGFHHLVSFGLGAPGRGFGAVGDVVVNRFGKGVGFLEDHADLGPQRHHIDILVVDIDAVQCDGPGDAAGVDGVVHAVQTAHEGRFAASGRADHGR